MTKIPYMCEECIVRITCEQVCENFVLQVEKKSIREPHNLIPPIFKSLISREYYLCRNCGRVDYMTFSKWKFYGTICRHCGFGAWFVPKLGKIHTVFFDWKPDRRRNI